MREMHESFESLMKDVDLHIDDMDERALNMLRRERADPLNAPDEPVPLTLKPFDAEPGDASCEIKYTYRNALTTVGEVIEDLAGMLDEAPHDISLVHCGVRLKPLALTLSDCNVFSGYVVYFKVEKRVTLALD